jgi:hypothetical protein
MKMNPSVFVGIPSGSDWKADFGMSLAGLVAAAGRPLKGGGYIERLQLWNTKGSILSRSRATLAKKAIELECSHLLFVDSDMTFPNWMLHQLLSHDKAIIGANCAVKSTPSAPTARLAGDSPAGTLLHSTAAQGIQKVWRLGTGVMLIKTSVFRDVPAPWFDITWNEQTQDYTGEDWNFCAKVQEAGIPIWVDHDLSRHIGHVGAYEYTHNDVEQQ